MLMKEEYIDKNLCRVARKDDWNPYGGTGRRF